MQRAFPRFHSDFLNDLVVAFQRRSRALKSSRLEILEFEESGTHGLEIVCRSLGPAINLTITRSVASLYLRHCGNRQRGKILLRLEGMKLLPKCAEIVEAFEQTVSQAHWMTPPNANGPAADAIRAIWSKLLSRAVD